jgi:hypothetical protein
MYTFAVNKVKFTVSVLLTCVPLPFIYGIKQPLYVLVLQRMRTYPLL